MSPAPYIKARSQVPVTGPAGAAPRTEEDPYRPPAVTLPETDVALPEVKPASTQTTTVAPTTDGSPPVTWQQLIGGDPTALGPVSGAPGAPLLIRRPEVVASYGKVPGGTGGAIDPNQERTYGFNPQSTSDEFIAEYWEKALADPVKRQWLANRALTLGFVTSYDPDSQYGVAEKEFTNGGVFAMWKWAGGVVQMNKTLNTLTPEQYMDLRYSALGGDSALGAVKQSAAPPNPITTQTQTSTYTMSRAQADAAADQIAQRLLGHMASDAEMKKARGVMNGILKANPTVSTTTTDRTDPDAVTSSTHTKGGASPDDAAAAYAMKIQRGSEGMAFNVGKLMEEAMMNLDRGL